MGNKILQQLGLSEGEAKVYFALLELESSTVGPIIDKAGVPDSKIYMILEKLKGKGLASFVIKNNVKHFQASDPKNLVLLLNEKQRDLQEQKNKLLKDIIPEIERKKKLTEDRQEARVYEGIDGLKSAFNYLLDTMDSGEEYYSFTFGEELSKKELLTFFRNYHNKREEKKIKVKFVAPTSKRQEIKKNYDYKLISTKFTKKSFPVGTLIFKGHVMTIVWSEKPTAFVIKSKRNYEYYKKFFEEIWRSSKT